MGLNEDLQRISEQERELQLPRLDAQAAWGLGSRVRAIAESRGLAVVVDVRRFGQPLFYTGCGSLHRTRHCSASTICPLPTTLRMEGLSHWPWRERAWWAASPSPEFRSAPIMNWLSRGCARSWIAITPS